MMMKLKILTSVDAVIRIDMMENGIANAICGLMIEKVSGLDPKSTGSRVF